MTEEVKDWLPPEAFSPDAIKAALSGPVAGWSASWLARGTVVISTVRAGEAGPAAQRCLAVRGVHAALEMPGLGKRFLLEAMLDVALAEVTLCDGDRQTLDLLATKAADDLVARLDAAFGTADPGDGGAWVRLSLSLEGNELLGVGFPAHACVALLKARLGGAHPPAHAPRGRGEALARTRLVAQGLIGNAELPVNELRLLSVGDVLVLDRALGEPVELRLPGSPHAFARGRLLRSGGQISIQL